MRKLSRPVTRPLVRQLVRRLDPLALGKGVGGFEPGRDLYLPGDILLDYDPADLTTMFKDTAGTQAVTADGDSIALHLDKGQWGGKKLAQVLAAQTELATNGGLADGTGWGGTTWSFSGGAAVCNGSSSLFQAVAAASGKTYRVTFDVVAYTSGTLQATIGNGTAVTGLGSLGSKSILVVCGAEATPQLRLTGGSLIASIDNVSVKEIPGYHRTQASGPLMRKYKTDGTFHWSLYDGSDDGDVTPTINWGTDKFASCSGLYKANDTVGVVFEFSPVISGNSGSFYLASGDNGGIGWSTSARGTATSNFAMTAVVLAAAPDTAVITAMGDISGDLSRIWRNRVVGADGTLDKGAGNFGSYALYFGRRGGASLPFNGREYRTVIRNRPWSASEQAKLEAFIAAKSGVTL